MRPLSYYKNLKNELSKSTHPIEGYYMETMWYDVFHPESLQAEYGPVCDVPVLPVHKALSHPKMMEGAHSRHETNMRKEMGAEWESVKRNLKMSDQYKGKKSEKSKKAKGRKGQGKKKKTSGGFTRI